MPPPLWLRPKNAVAAGHCRYALSLARRTRSDAHIRCPLGSWRMHSRTDTLSCKRADICVAALSVERTVSHAVGHWQRTQPESRSLTAACAPLKRPLSRQHTGGRTLLLTRSATGSVRSLNRAVSGQINLFVLDERCAVVCRNRTAIQLPAEFYLRPHSAEPEKSYDRDMRGIRQEHAIQVPNQKRYTSYILSTSF